MQFTWVCGDRGSLFRYVVIEAVYIVCMAIEAVYLGVWCRCSLRWLCGDRGILLGCVVIEAVYLGVW
jgi:hypothetical protein